MEFAMLFRVSRVIVLLALAAAPVSAEVVRIEVTSRADLVGGQPFGAAGPYEKLAGKIFFAVDPSLPANRIVTDIDNAPRNAAGKVEFSSDFFLIKPKRIERGNGALLYEVSNRGGKGMLGFFNHATGSLDPSSLADMGDGFLMKQGFTLLWVGWQFDPPQRAGLVRVYPPVATLREPQGPPEPGRGTTENGKPIRGVVRSDFVVTEREADHSLADRDHAAYVAGAGRGSFNHRFAQPSRDGHPYLNFFYPTDIFPFTDAAETDPLTGATDGLLTHAGSPDLLPKVFYTNSEYEYWGRAASLIHTTPDGASDAPLMDNVRIYLLTAGQHGPGPFPPTQTIGQQRNNPLDYRWAMKALLLDMDRWIADGTPPPPSRYPHISDGTLVAPDRLRFPKVPGVRTSTT